jgi:hypothetical protein
MELYHFGEERQREAIRRVQERQRELVSTELYICRGALGCCGRGVTLEAWDRVGTVTTQGETGLLCGLPTAGGPWPGLCAQHWLLWRGATFRMRQLKGIRRARRKDG